MDTMRPLIRSKVVVWMLFAVLLLAFSTMASADISAGAGNFSTGNNGSGAPSISITAPVTSQFDVLIAQVTVVEPSGTITVIYATTGSGWELVRRDIANDKVVQAIFYRVVSAAGGEGAGSHAFEIRGGTSCAGAPQSRAAIGGITRFSGVDNA